MLLFPLKLNTTMAQPIFSTDELASFRAQIDSAQKDTITYPNYADREFAVKKILSAYFAQAIERIRKDRMQEFLNYLVIIVGSKGSYANIPVWQGFADSDEPKYAEIFNLYNTDLNRRHLHTFLSATLIAPRNWALTAFVKFLRGNKVAGGKANNLDGFGSFHKDSGWNERQVNNVASVFFDERSDVSKLFMQYDADLRDEVYEQSQVDENVSYQAQFAATDRIINKDFLNELIILLEKSGLAPKPTTTKKVPKPHVPKIFKEGDIIRENTIRDLPGMSIIEISVLIRKKHGQANTEGTVQIVLVEPAKPGYYLKIWRIVGQKAFLPDNNYEFDSHRKSLIGAKYIGIWEQGVQAQKDGYEYPYDYIGLKG